MQLFGQISRFPQALLSGNMEFNAINNDITRSDSHSVVRMLSLFSGPD